jgi:hypothetical protein
MEEKQDQAEERCPAGIPRRGWTSQLVSSLFTRIEMVLYTSVDQLMRLLAREYLTEKCETINLTNKNTSFHKVYYIN